MKKTIRLFITLTLLIALTACSKSSKKTTVIVFAAASLNTVMSEFETLYESSHDDVDIVINADSSNTLMTQIQEGAACDVFFSAAQKQMDILQDDGFLVDGTRTNVVNNQLVVITQPDSTTEVTSLKTIAKAKSIALADGSVPVGKYTRQAMINIGLLKKVDDPSTISTEDVSTQLGGVEISEQGNVSKVLAAVEEGSCEVGTTYLSDTIGHEDKVKIIETVGYDKTGNIIYPIAQIANKDATEEEFNAAKDFISYITNDDAKALYQKYGFDTNVD